MSCPGLESVLHTLSQHGLFNGDRYCWLLFGLDRLEDNRLLLQGLNFTVSTNAVLVQPIGARNYAVLDVSGRWAMDTWELSLVQVGSWSILAGLEVWDKRNAYQRRINLGGIRLKGVDLMNTIEAFQYTVAVGEAE
ncbi:ionotropic glutamate receptor [Anopheles sinensis]|uniref:Ionotropic glutamate receptor n=1 Tax=Anopheles sinensis TaxID=74873 RepID=A0A084VRN3_ANOSI|nr:ionotropic glutamate receptor [Anopheles sinensis]